MAAGLKWYFAYGSNMSAARLFEGRLKPEGVAWGDRLGGRLDGWRLTFDKQARTPLGAGAGNIVMADGGTVYGTLNALPPKGFDVLDIHEGVAGGHYERRTLPVVRADNGETVEALVYVALKVTTGLRPTRAYLAFLLAGSDLLPADYLERLRATPTID
ncbi:MAG: gamma-glutamylcyclotransferase [Reyranella sp.]|uniref:gamma-glutamylcyclotransferase n=1 Tax=Reyranella sp. TaxID=1929291 RepID=UPI002731CA2B|nr:gamma-glutamylcyclotransferase [Reyranella sp.]MDP1966560.1 gamma-glutamylcyclotransferase [Reyranella sp.]MDP2376845.1 gamma-glutamylcyclotransferase [Reyranella sp.]